MIDILELHRRLMENQNENSPYRTESDSYIKARIAAIEQEDDEDRRKFLQGILPKQGGYLGILQP